MSDIKYKKKGSELSASPHKKKGSVKFVSPEKRNFFSVLRKRVDNHFTENHISKTGGFPLFFKTFILLVVYAAPFLYILLTNPGWGISLLCWTAMGLGMAGLGMSVMHDANHGAYSSNKIVNWCMAHVLNLMGGSTVNWKLQHNILHHTYTNVTGMDDDIANKPGLRLSPHEKRQPAHKYQWWHAFLLYSLTTIYWATAKDFMQWIRYRRNRVNAMTKSVYRWMLVKLIAGKLIYFFVFLVMPPLFFDVSFGRLLTGFLWMHALAGVILTVIFQLAHSLEGTTHPLPNESGVIANDWAIHQMNTTVDFSPDNKILSWYIGGLNYQVEHHLFPGISHIHYPAISKILQQTASEFSVPYLRNDSFKQAFRLHVQFLRKLGRLPDLEEAVG